MKQPRDIAIIEPLEDYQHALLAVVSATSLREGLEEFLRFNTEFGDVMVVGNTATCRDMQGHDHLLVAREHIT